MATAGVPVLGQTDPASRDRGRPPAAGEGVRRRRRPRHARRPRRWPTCPTRSQRRGARRASAFGDGTVFLEPYVEHGRHVEVQVVGDTHGACSSSASATARCSAATRRSSRRRRRPACPTTTCATRCTTPRATAAEAIGYVGAGTVEFLYDAERRAVLLPRDEHPPPGRAPGHRGWSRRRPGRAAARASPRAARSPERARPSRAATPIEVRLYAEDPAADYQPQSGGWTPSRSRLSTASSPCRPTASALDAGFVSGSEVGTHYDAMLAKVIAWAPTAREAARALAGVAGAGPDPRRWSPTGTCWSACCATTAFLAGEVSTDFLERTSTSSRPSATAPGRRRLLAAAVALAERRPGGARCSAGIPVGLAQRRLAAAAHRAVDGDGRSRRRLVRRSRRLRVDRRRRPCCPPRRATVVARGRRGRVDGVGRIATSGVATPVVHVDVRTRLRRLRAVPAVRRPGRPGRRRLAARADAGHRGRRRRSRRDGSRPGRPCWCSRR